MDWNPSCGGATEIRSGKLARRRELGTASPWRWGQAQTPEIKAGTKRTSDDKGTGNGNNKKLGFWTAAHWALESKLHWLARSTISREKSQTPISNPKPATEISDRTKIWLIRGKQWFDKTKPTRLPTKFRFQIGIGLQIRDGKRKIIARKSTSGHTNS
jgi:hypothetical protein